jgi:hypothetical protein
MTIFLEIAKQRLTKELTSMRDSSVGADLCVWNVTFMAAIKLDRNTDLSSEKRRLLNGLITALAELKDKENDAATNSALVELITTCRINIFARSQAYNYSEGDTERHLDNLKLSWEKVVLKLTELGLLNLPHDKDPAHCFCYHIAEYCAKSIFVNDKANPIGEVLKHSRISNARFLSHDKDALIKQKIPECFDMLKEKKEKIADLAQRKNNSTLTFLRDMQLENLQLYVKYGFSTCDSFQDRFFSTKVPLTDIQPGGGSLGKHLREAYAEIKANLGLLTAEQTASLSIMSVEKC